MELYIVDAFTEHIYGGNQAGVVLLDGAAEFPDAALMQQIAAELKHSETAFVKRMDSHLFDIRYFTPEGEVDLCGHATISAFTVLREEKALPSGKYTAKTAARCRNFAPLYGIDEEAATGTSNGALTYYLYSQDRISEQDENTFIQGESMGRPSIIKSRIGPDEGICVGGSAVISICGRLKD